MKTVIVNGANGYVASNFISHLLKQNYMVIALVRANYKDAEERMNDVLVSINNEVHTDTTRLEVYDYSLLGNDFEMNKTLLKSIFSSNVDYFHFAASLKYDEKSVDEIFSVNVEGVENSIKVFSKYAKNGSRFIYIGTAYSCGFSKGIFKEGFYKNEDISAFRNYYEQSKRFAENIVRGHFQKNGLNAYVIRLSQVIGNHKTGVVKTDYGIFDFAKRVHRLAMHYPNEVVKVHVDPAATQNLIPVDTVIRHLTKVVEENNVPRIMNFVSKNPVQNSFIIESLNRLVPLHLVPVKKLERKTLSPVEKLIALGMSFTESYASVDISFDSRQRDKFLNNPETGPDNNSVAKMLEYFIGNLSVKQREKKIAAALTSG